MKQVGYDYQIELLTHIDNAYSKAIDFLLQYNNILASRRNGLKIRWA
jgi:hypothetical protein